MHNRSNPRVKTMTSFLSVCACSLVFAGLGLTEDWSSTPYDSSSVIMPTAYEEIQQWSRPTVPSSFYDIGGDIASSVRLPQASFAPVTLPQVPSQHPEAFLGNYRASLPEYDTIIPVISRYPAINIPVVQPAIVTPVVTLGISSRVPQIPGAVVAPVIRDGYVPAVAPRVNMDNGGEWQYSSGVDPAIISLVRSGSQNNIGQRISFSAGGYDFSGIVMSAKPNEMAVKADNSAWFGLITTSSSDSLTIMALAFFDEGTADLSSVEVLNNGATLRMSGTDFDGTTGTVDLDIVGGKTVPANPVASQLSGLTVTSSGVVYELIENPAKGLNLMRVNSISYEDGTIVIVD